MSVPATLGRRLTLGLGLLVVAALAACDQGPTQPNVVRGRQAAHDDDPSTCANGWIVVQGHIYCLT
jgi:hypothetical protein